MPLPKRTVVGSEALAALAVPARLAVLNHLLAAGPRTASQCAGVVGITPSNCSWHLRALAKVGLVEPAPDASGDGRTRPWQATVVGLEFGGPEIARQALEGVAADYSDRLHERYLAARAELPAEWTRVADSSDYGLQLTPDELADLLARVEALIRPYVRPIRRRPPPGSAAVHLTLRAFPNPDVRAR